MKRFLAVGLAVVIAMFALSCQQIVDDTSAAVVDELSFADSPVWGRFCVGVYRLVGSFV